MWKKSAATIVLAWVSRNLRQLCPTARARDRFPRPGEYRHRRTARPHIPGRTARPGCAGTSSLGLSRAIPAPAPGWPALCAASPEHGADTTSAAGSGSHASAAGCAGRRSGRLDGDDRRAAAGRARRAPPVSPGQPRTLDLALEHGDLMAQDQDLRVLGPVGPGEQGEPAKYPNQRYRHFVAARPLTVPDHEVFAQPACQT